MPFIGIDKIDIAAASRLGVLVANSPTPENFIAVAEATMALTLMLQKRIKHNESQAAPRGVGAAARTAASSCSARRWGWSASAAWAPTWRGAW